MSKGQVRCIAIHSVTADRLYQPGEPLELSRADAKALESAGAVKVVAEKPAAPRPAAEPSHPVTLVKGVGAKVAKTLAGFAIESLTDLAQLSDEKIERIGGELKVVGDPREAVTRWRDEARALIEAERDGE